MGLFSFLSKRNISSQDIVNPCPVNTENNSPSAKALIEYANKDKVPAMSLSAFFAAVNLVSNSIAMMDWKFKDENGNELPKTHSLYHLFDNSTLNKFNIIKNVVVDMILYGNGFIYIERDRRTGEPKTLHYSPAKQTTIYYNQWTHKTYIQNLSLSESWDAYNYLHFFTNSANGFIGTGVLLYAYNVLDISSSVQKATESYYSTTGQMFGIVTPNGELPAALGNKKDQLNKLEASWNEARRKTQKGTMFFPADLKYIPTMTTAKDSSLIDSREYNAVEVGRFICNINPVLLGDLRHNVYGTLVESQREFIIHSLAPITTCYEDEMNRKLIMPSKLGRQFVDLDEYSILATDPEKQANCINTLTGGTPAISINEAREKLNLPPIEGGDKIIVPYSKIEDNIIGETTNT